MKTPVLILSEEPPGIVQERLEALGCVKNDSNLIIHAMPKNIDADALADIGRWLSQTHGLFVVDTISQFSGIEEDSSNGEITKKLLPLIRLVRQHEGTLLFVHHDRKNGDGADVGKMIRGGSAYLAIVDMAFMMGRTGGKDSRRRVIEAIGRYRTVPSRTEVEWDGGVGYELVSGGPFKAEGPAKTGAEVKLWKVLPVAPAEGLTTADLAQAAGIERTTIGRILGLWERREKRNPIISTGSGTKNDPKKWARNDCRDDGIHPYTGVRAIPPSIEVTDSLGPSGVNDGNDGIHALTPRKPAIPSSFSEPVDLIATWGGTPIDHAVVEGILGRIDRAKEARRKKR